MTDLKSNSPPDNSKPNEIVVTQCFNCGCEIEMPAVRLEAMDASGQDVYCDNCDEDADFNVGVYFVPFF